MAKQQYINIEDYMTVEALEDGLTLSLSSSLNEFQYCVDGSGIWKAISTGNETESINAGQTICSDGIAVAAVFVCGAGFHDRVADL